VATMAWSWRRRSWWRIWARRGERASLGALRAGALVCVIPSAATVRGRRAEARRERRGGEGGERRRGESGGEELGFVEEKGLGEEERGPAGRTFFYLRPQGCATDITV
jgi:hypothetical protein